MKRILLTLITVATSVVIVGCRSPRIDAGRSLPVSMSPDAMEPRAERDRMLVWQATLELEVANVSDAISRACSIVKQSGGYVENKASHGKEGAYVTLRVPAKSLTSTVDSLAAIGKVLGKTVSSEDVTDQYVDVEARLANMVALRDRFRGLLGKAEDVKDILAIEKELSRVQADIDSMQARIKALKGQVDFARVRVSVHRRRILGPLGYVCKGAWWVVGRLFVIQE